MREALAEQAPRSVLPALHRRAHTLPETMHLAEAEALTEIPPVAPVALEVAELGEAPITARPTPAVAVEDGLAATPVRAEAAS